MGKILFNIGSTLVIAVIMGAITYVAAFIVFWTYYFLLWLLPL